MRHISSLNIPGTPSPYYEVRLRSLYHVYCELCSPLRDSLSTVLQTKLQIFRHEEIHSSIALPKVMIQEYNAMRESFPVREERIVSFDIKTICYTMPRREIFLQTETEGDVHSPRNGSIRFSSRRERGPGQAILMYGEGGPERATMKWSELAIAAI